MNLIIGGKSKKVGRNDLCPCGSGVKFKKCCWEIYETKEFNSHLSHQDRQDGPTSPVSRIEMQSMMGQIAKLIEKKGMSVEEANKYFTGRHMDDIASECRELSQTPKERAEDLAFKAHSAKSPKERILLAQQAKELDPDCAEAYLVLEQALSNDPVESIGYYEKAIAAAERTLGPEFFKEHAGHFWGLHETRSYMRARFHMAQDLWQLHRQSEAIAHCIELLRLNPNDNLGVRYVLFDYLLVDNRLSEIEALIKQFKDDGTAHCEYNILLYYFKKFGTESEQTKKQVQKAFKANAYIEKYLTGKNKIPDTSPDSYSLGSKEEAICYAQDSILAWLNTPNAAEWLQSLDLKITRKDKPPRP